MATLQPYIWLALGGLFQVFSFGKWTIPWRPPPGARGDHPVLRAQRDPGLRVLLRAGSGREFPALRPRQLAADLWTAYRYRLQPKVDPRLLDDEDQDVADWRSAQEK